MQLSDDIVYLKGVGPARAKVLADELGILTAGDLLNYFPFRHIDRTNTATVASLTEESGLVVLSGTVSNMQTVSTGPHRERLTVDLDQMRLRLKADEAVAESAPAEKTEAPAAEAPAEAAPVKAEVSADEENAAPEAKTAEAPAAEAAPDNVVPLKPEAAAADAPAAEEPAAEGGNTDEGQEKSAEELLSEFEKMLG